MTEYEVPEKVVPSDVPIVPVSDIDKAAEELVEAAIKKERELYKDKHDRPGRFGLQGLGPTEEELREEFSWIPERVKDFHTPYPDMFDEDLIPRIRSVANVFSASGATGGDLRNSGDEEREGEYRGLERYFTARSRVSEWHGMAATNFIQNFLLPIADIMEEHGRLAVLLLAEAEKSKEVYKARRTNVKDVLEKGTKAVEAIELPEFDYMDILLPGIIAAGTFMTLGSGSLAFVGANLISGATMAGPFMPEEPEKEPLPLASGSVAGVLDNVKNALDEIEKSTQEQEDTLIEAMQRTDALIQPNLYNVNGERTALIPMRPKLVDADIDSIKDRMIPGD